MLLLPPTSAVKVIESARLSVCVGLWDLLRLQTIILAKIFFDGLNSSFRLWRKQQDDVVSLAGRSTMLSWGAKVATCLVVGCDMMLYLTFSAKSHVFLSMCNRVKVYGTGRWAHINLTLFICNYCYRYTWRPFSERTIQIKTTERLRTSRVPPMDIRSFCYWPGSEKNEACLIFHVLGHYSI